jgi:uncharacterized membrane protein YphA (DoxX/SURF4 family)
MDPVIHSILAYSLALLFAVSVLHKLREPKAFRAVVTAYELLPAGLLSVAAVSVIVLEIGVTILFLIPALHVYGAFAAGLLLGGYALAIAVNLARGQRDIDCGCNGFGIRQMLSPWLVVRNLLLIAICAVVAVPSTGRPLAWPDGVLILFGIVVLALLYTAMQQLIANQPRLAALRARRA